MLKYIIVFRIFEITKDQNKCEANKNRFVLNLVSNIFIEIPDTKKVFIYT